MNLGDDHVKLNSSTQSFKFYVSFKLKMQCKSKCTYTHSSKCAYRCEGIMMLRVPTNFTEQLQRFPFL